MNKQVVFMPSSRAGLSLVSIIAMFSCASAVLAAGSQASLTPTLVDKSVPSLTFDWPMIKVGAATYEEGPTGVTVLQFAKKAYVAIDARGGGPGTVNAPYVELGYDVAELDSIVIAGGSWYGLEATTAVASALKDDGIRDGNAFSLEPSVAMSLGSIIFDFGTRRLNEIYPDKRLAQVAYRDATPGWFPLGAVGAGRLAKTGGFFGCSTHSGQGAAFQQIGDIKIAAFSVVNAYGAVTDRAGKVQACYTKDGLKYDLPVGALYEQFSTKFKDRTAKESASGSLTKNTTISVIVVNQKLEPALLKRLAVQVHTSMARYIQPYATLFDGDVLYAVSTAEINDPELSPVELGVMASEVMWDAVLASRPAQQPQHAVANPKLTIAPDALAKLVGVYTFSDLAELTVREVDGKLVAEATGERAVFAIPKGKPTELVPVSSSQFTVPSHYPLLLDFTDSSSVILNPGHWQQVGTKQ